MTPDFLPSGPADSSTTASSECEATDEAAVLSALPDVCFVLDGQWRLTCINPPGEKLLAHLSPTPASSRLGRSILTECPEVADSAFSKVCREAQAENRSVEEEVFYPTLGRWFSLLVRPAGERLCVFLRDVTERAKLERELRRRVEELADSERGKDAFLVELAHEIRNAFAPVRNALHLVGAHDLGPETARACALAEQRVQRLSGLVDALMTVSRFTLAPPSKQRVNLIAVVTQALSSAVAASGEGGRTFSVRLPSGALWLDADPRQLEQIVGRLLDDAVRNTGPTGEVGVRVAREAGWAVLRVRNDGEGVAPEVLSPTFHSFTVLDHGQWGRGVVLKLVRRLVELHGGSLETKSTGPETGSEFVVRLPLPQDARADLVRPSVALHPRQMRVLVVEDDMEAAESLKLLLTGWQCEVILASNGMEGIEAARAHHPDLVLMDIGMPRMDGYEAAERLRQDPDGRGLPLVALTGYGQDEERDRARESGFDYHMVKPVDPADLKDLVNYYRGLAQPEENAQGT